MKIKTSFFLLLFIGISLSCRVTAQAKQIQQPIYGNLNNTINLHEKELEKLSNQTFVALLEPYIRKSIVDYYGNYLSYSPTFSPKYVDIIQVDKLKDQGEIYKITLEVSPYIGPHNVIGRDIITFRIKNMTNITVEKYKHVESFKIPPNYKNIVKKWPPN